ncbi:MAG: helix-turn-helix domain-containing protein [Lachnospiraceae bacterium]|nr:helix-turn-helix domain-containing protein [Lachnospiraceae bacterium]
MANKVGKLIKQARTDAGLTQEQLARKVKGADTSDISKAERGQLKLTNDQLKQIAKATGVTQKSLIEAAASSTYSSSSSGSSKPSSSSSSSTSSSSKTSMKLTATEKRLVELYRAADSDTKKQAMSVLKGTSVVDTVGDFLGSAIDSLFKK